MSKPGQTHTSSYNLCHSMVLLAPSLHARNQKRRNGAPGMIASSMWKYPTSTCPCSTSWKPIAKIGAATATDTRICRQSSFLLQRAFLIDLITHGPVALASRKQTNPRSPIAIVTNESPSVSFGGSPSQIAALIVSSTTIRQDRNESIHMPVETRKSGNTTTIPVIRAIEARSRRIMVILVNLRLCSVRSSAGADRYESNPTLFTAEHNTLT